MSKRFELSQNRHPKDNEQLQHGNVAIGGIEAEWPLSIFLAGSCGHRDNSGGDPRIMTLVRGNLRRLYYRRV
jgi:hypothetical protein